MLVIHKRPLNFCLARPKSMGYVAYSSVIMSCLGCERNWWYWTRPKEIKGSQFIPRNHMTFTMSSCWDIFNLCEGIRFISIPAHSQSSALLMCTFSLLYVKYVQSYRHFKEANSAAKANPFFMFQPIEFIKPNLSEPWMLQNECPGLC